MNRENLHSDCFFCGPDNPTGLQLKFAPTPDGGVSGVFAGNQVWQGYAGYLHGGIIAGLLDSAMTNCLLVQNVCAMTAELKIRYKKKVPATACLTVHAAIDAARPPLYCLSAELSDNGEILASAEAKFMLTNVTATDVCRANQGGASC